MIKGNKIIKKKEALKFIFAGKSIVTFLNTNTENRFTYKIKQAKNSNLFFVSVLTSPDVYSYIGICLEGNFKHGKKSNINPDSQSVKVFQYMPRYL